MALSMIMTSEALDNKKVEGSPYKYCNPRAQYNYNDLQYAATPYFDTIS